MKQIPLPTWWTKAGPKARGRNIPLPKWWIAEARQWLNDENRTKSDAQIGAELATTIKRPAPFDHSYISNFRRNKGIFKGDDRGIVGMCTLELTVALCLKYDLQWPMFFPRDRNESLALRDKAAEYDYLDDHQPAEPVTDRMRELAAKTQKALADVEPAQHEREATHFAVRRVSRRR